MSLNSKLSATDIAIEKMSKNTQKEIIKEFSRALKEMRGSLGLYYEKYSKDGVLTYSEMAKYNRLKALNDELSKKLASVYKSNGKNIKGLLENVYNEAYLGAGYAIETEAMVNLKFAMINMDTITASIENPISGLTLSERLEKHRGDIIINIKSEVTQGLIRGEGYSKIAKRIKSKLDGDASKSIRVAQTETHRVLNQGRLQAGIKADAMGVKMLKVWDATLDSKTRNSHQSLDGKKIGVNDYFNSSIGGHGLVPGSLGLAEDDINCRCAIRYEIDGLSPKLRATRDENNKTVLIPSMNYMDWKALKGIK